MPKPILQHEFWPGPLRPTTKRDGTRSTKCVGQEGRCRRPTINDDFLCYDCKDPDGYAARLRKAHQEALQRCLEAYPVCRRCGNPLTQQQVDAGQTRHRMHTDGQCRTPLPDEPLAQRRNTHA